MNKITKTTTHTKNVTHDRFRRLAAAAVVAAAALWGSAARAADPQQLAVRDNAEVRPVATQSVANKPNPVEGKDGKVSIMVNKSLVLATKLPYKTVNVANPDVVDFNRVDDYQILLTAKRPGTTQLMIWDVGGGTQTVDVAVTTDIETLRDQFKTILPDTDIQISSVNGTIALRGRVPNLETAEKAVAIAKPFGADVLNFLEVAGGQQVMLKVRFAEVSRSAAENLGFSGFATDGSNRYGWINGPAGNPIGALATGGSYTVDPRATVFGSGGINGTQFEFFLEALRKNNLLRVLAEPNLVTYSGKSAQFLAGGEFPVPVPQTGNGGGGTTITVEYKQFGVQLAFTPVVLGSGRIRLEVAPEVSDLDYSRSVSFQGFVIPTITKRNLKTTIEMNEGQTFAVAGLLNNRTVANRDGTPGLMDLPVLGALFRSTRYERSETELVVLVTPYVVEPMNPDQVPALPGERWREPNELDLILGKDLCGELPDKKNAPKHEKSASTAPARFRGEYGFSPAK
jgi:pilus assembly protein CpaC